MTEERILAVDLGDRRTGLAISAPGGTFAVGLPAIEADGPDEVLERIALLVQERRIDEVVVGLPRNMSGTLGPRARLTLEFADRLRAYAGVRVTTWDERLTSVQAESMVAPLGLSRKRKKTQVNTVAAQLILESYLQSKRRSGPGAAEECGPDAADSAGDAPDEAGTEGS